MIQQAYDIPGPETGGWSCRFNNSVSLNLNALSHFAVLNQKEKTMKLLRWIAASAVVCAGTASQAQNRVEVVVQQVKDSTGTVRVGLFTDEESFLKKPVMAKIVKATSGKVVAVFESVPAGHYAVSIIHDSNRNGKLDSNLFGMPKEGFGFSNDAMGTFGPPDFAKAKFQVSSSMTVTIKTRYL